MAGRQAGIQKMSNKCPSREKENMSTGRFCSPIRSQGEVVRKQKDRQIPGPCQKTEKTLDYEGESDTNCCWCPWNSPQ